MIRNLYLGSILCGIVEDIEVGCSGESMVLWFCCRRGKVVVDVCESVLRRSKQSILCDLLCH
jgi:hypothetical protein